MSIDATISNSLLDGVLTATVHVHINILFISLTFLFFLSPTIKIVKKKMKNEYFIKIECKIDNQMQVFFKNCVK